MEDTEVILSALADPFIRHMDVEYARLAKEIPLPKETSGICSGVPKANVIENAAASYKSPNTGATGGTVS